MESPKPEKPNISRDNLKSNHIEYDERIYDPEAAFRNNTALPTHVDNLRRALLNFKNAIPKNLAESFKKDRLELIDSQYWKEKAGREKEEKKPNETWSLLPPDCAYWEPLHWPQDEVERRIAKFNADINKDDRAARYARTLTRSAEAGWTHFLLTSTFTKFQNDSSSWTPYDELFDQWILEQEVPWTEHSTIRIIDGETKVLTGPKPDLTYAFPIFDDADLADLPAGFVDHDAATNFHRDTLLDLRRLGLISSPTTGLQRILDGKKKELKTPDLLCFPWAVVEVKIAGAARAKEEFCYCQAANASATALDILKSLFETAARPVPDDLPPIIAFTSVGPELKLWLTYLDSSAGGYQRKMICLWATNLRLKWGIYATRLIVMHMHLWASRILKPRISVCLSMIRSKRPALRPYMPITPPSSASRLKNVPDLSLNDTQLQTPSQVPQSPTDITRGSTLFVFGSQRSEKSSRVYTPIPVSQPSENPFIFNTPIQVQQLSGKPSNFYTPIPVPRPSAKSFHFGLPLRERSSFPPDSNIPETTGDKSQSQTSPGSSTLSSAPENPKSVGNDTLEVAHSSPDNTSITGHHSAGWYERSSYVQGSSDATDERSCFERRYHKYRVDHERTLLLQTEPENDDKGADGDYVPNSDTEDGEYDDTSYSDDTNEDTEDEGNLSKGIQNEDTESTVTQDDETIKVGIPNQDTENSEVEEEDEDNENTTDDDSYGDDAGDDDDTCSYRDSNLDDDDTWSYRDSNRDDDNNYGDDSDGEDDADDENGDDFKADDNDHYDNEPDQASSQSVPAEFLTTNDIAQLRKKALRALDGLEITNLPGFDAIVNVLNDNHLSSACTSLYFSWIEHSENMNPDKGAIFKSIWRDLQIGLERPISDKMDASQISPLIETVRVLRVCGNSGELRRICTGLASVLGAPWCAEALLKEGFYAYEEKWAQLEEQALDMIIRSSETNERLPPLAWEENPGIFGTWPVSKDDSEESQDGSG